VQQIFTHPADDYTKALFAAAPGRGWEFEGGVARPV
jgi:hypothetical protein